MVQATLNLKRVEAELVKSQEEVVHSLEEGYKICWDSAVAAGLEMGDLSFDKYCEGLAVGGDRVGAGSSTAVVEEAVAGDEDGAGDGSKVDEVDEAANGDDAEDQDEAWDMSP